MLTDWDMASLRAVATSTQTDACTILRSGATLATTVCSLTPEPASIQPIPADRLQPEKRWIVRLPYGTSVQRGDVVQTLGQQYAVVELDGPRSYELATQVYCIRSGSVADDAGTPANETSDYLHPNAVITLKRRAGSVVYTNRPVRLDFPQGQESITPAGQLVSAWLYDLPGSDYRQGDLVQVVSMSGQPVAGAVQVFSASTPTLISNPDALVRVPLVGVRR